MVGSNRRARSRRWLTALVLIVASGAGPASHADEGEGTPLALPEAVRLAVSGQPLLDQLEAQARAARATGIAAGQLPDPQLTFGILDVPADTGDAGSFRNDADTRLQVGLTQEFPRADKRRLRGELSAREAERLTVEQQLTARQVGREAALAWLDLWRAEEALSLTRLSLGDAQTQMSLAEIALKTGTATQAEYLAARMEVNRLRDAVSGAEQGVAHARSGLSRWIGDAALRPVAPELPAVAPLPALGVLLERWNAHPQVQDAEAQAAEARTAAELAEAAYQPDWRVELAYAERPAFSELVTLQVGIDLPLFTRHRQDQGLAAALAKQDAAKASIEDARRRWLSEARLNHHDAERLIERLRVYDETLLPQSRARIDAALGGWRSGRSPFRDVLEARRDALDVRMTKLDLQFDLERHFVQLTYLGAWDTASAAETFHE